MVEVTKLLQDAKEKQSLFNQFYGTYKQDLKKLKRLRHGADKDMKEHVDIELDELGKEEDILLQEIDVLREKLGVANSTIAKEKR